MNHLFSVFFSLKSWMKVGDFAALFLQGLWDFKSKFLASHLFSLSQRHSYVITVLKTLSSRVQQHVENCGKTGFMSTGLKLKLADSRKIHVVNRMTGSRPFLSLFFHYFFHKDTFQHFPLILQQNKNNKKKKSSLKIWFHYIRTDKDPPPFPGNPQSL